MIIPMCELNAMHPEISTKRLSIYYLNSMLIAKRFQHLNDYQRRCLLEKYNYAKEIGPIEGLNLPIDLLETEKGICGYIEPKIGEEYCNFVDYYNLHNNEITLDAITKYILAVCTIVEACHKHNIVNPDMATGGNVLYNSENGNVLLSDYHDMQVGNLRTDNISSFVAFDPILSTPKYFNGGLYSKNIDLYTLAIRYFYYATKLNVPKTRAVHGDMEYLLNIAGISSTLFADCFRALFNPNIDNLNIEEAIKELNDSYIISEFKPGVPRRFLKK
ncbi:MAG: hypothetical protein NC483_07710 [Ruminococcus sp.]|nr:hypothetical protein [Ruminococcus sp.]